MNWFGINNFIHKRIIVPTNFTNKNVIINFSPSLIVLLFAAAQVDGAPLQSEVELSEHSVASQQSVILDWVAKRVEYLVFQVAARVVVRVLTSGGVEGGKSDGRVRCRLPAPPLRKPLDEHAAAGVGGRRWGGGWFCGGGGRKFGRRADAAHGDLEEERSILEYARVVWDPYQAGICHDLEEIQKKAIRFIINKHY